MIRHGLPKLGCALLLASAYLTARPDELVIKSQQAKEAMRAGRFEEAVALYSELLRAIPGDVGLMMNRGLALHSAGRYRDAIGQFEAVVQQQPKLSPAWLFIGLAHLKLGEPEQAITPLETALKGDPNNQTARLELADALLSAGRPEAAAAQFEELTEREPANPKAWQGLGLSYIARAQRLFDELERIAPESAYRSMLLARASASQGKHQTAFHLYRQALAQDPKLRGAHAGIAEIYRSIGRPDWAAVEEERERSLPSPDCAASSYECDFIAGRLHQVVRAAQAHQTPEALYWRARAYGELSLQAFARLSAMPPSAAIYELMAEAYRVQGRYHLAVKQWEQASELAPQDRRVKKGLARALWLNKEYPKARARLEALIKLEPESAELNYWLGDTLLDSGGSEAAIPYLEKALKQAPDYKAAHAALGRACLRMNLAEKAIPHLKAALELDEEGTIYYQLAQAYRKAGQKALAEQTLRKFQDISERARRRKPTGESQPITPP